MDCAPAGGQDQAANLTDLTNLVFLELNRAPVAERGMEPACIVDVINEPRKARGKIRKSFTLHETASTFSVFMKLSAFALS